MRGGFTMRAVSSLSLLLLLAGCAAPTAMPTVRDYKVDGRVQIDQSPNAARVAPTLVGLKAGAQVIGTKVFQVPKYDGVKNDGETAFTLTNLTVTVYWVKNPNGSTETTAVVGFIQTNHTQNDKGVHNHTARFGLLGAAGNLLDPNVMPYELERDTCAPSNPKASGTHTFQTDIFPQVQTLSYGWSGRWTYEGKC
jgi:hypothetical protein